MSRADRARDGPALDANRFYVLLALAAEQRGEEAIARDAERCSGGTVSLDGVLRRVLRIMIADGWVRPSAPGAGRSFILTETGRRAASAEAERLAALSELARRRNVLPRDS